ncbi:hypothetical protein B296_00046653 [Ensete ventricosum]|uniref:ATP synthase A/B type C-terminal domain-containing protein n=1 Tax=Ensete ventricosum TaxID=4639 RepID=A0A426YCY6_ENSVE|nr:hypothetical protein B296_00046653 [Ensete ventricosum]
MGASAVFSPSSSIVRERNALILAERFYFCTDITHPAPDLTGYITEGQIYIDRQLHNRQVMYMLHTLLSQRAHFERKHCHQRIWSLSLSLCVPSYLHACLSMCIFRDETASCLLCCDCCCSQLYLEFLDKFERKFVTQGAYDTRNIFQSLDLAWTLLRIFPRELLHRIPAKTLDQYYSRDTAH